MWEKEKHRDSDREGETERTRNYTRGTASCRPLTKFERERDGVRDKERRREKGRK